MTTESLTAQTAAPRSGLKIGLWVAQSLICAAFVFFGCQKLFVPPESLAEMWHSPWPVQMPLLLHVTGLVDVVGGLGILLPALTRIQPQLTLWAARGCVLLQVLAIIFHLARGEAMATPLNAVLLALCVFIVWGLGRRKQSTAQLPTAAA